MMTDSASGSAETLVRTSDRLPAAKKSAKIHFGEVIDADGSVRGDLQAVTQPPHQQVLRSPDVSGKKPKSSRRSGKRSSLEGPVLSASHIEGAAGDDRCARCLLAVLFCEVSILCSSVLGCLSPCGSLCPCGLLSARLWPCDPGCAVLDEGCRSSDCLDICLECCSLCFPS
ncbi:myoD family inhibitor domain-containing protein-like isoform 3-T3 [Anomaloglossus baeobatrachus]|uniref:myoD family inhibitor domain-containing protein-like isoform X3 n=1 Tax=Anomaloglossus baeobatrachus TaxID=238106 RepID=UPI003F5084D0